MSTPTIYADPTWNPFDAVPPALQGAGYPGAEWAPAQAVGND